MTLAWGAKVSPEFRRKAIAIALELGADPSDLMSCMAFESGETFSPSVKNPNSSATGLIQFMTGPDSWAAAHGYTRERLSAMTDVEQLDVVREYFAPYRGRLKTLSDVYMAILWPTAVGLPDDAIIFKPGSKAFLANRGLDIDHDGAVSKGEAAAFVAAKLTKGMTLATEERDDRPPTTAPPGAPTERPIMGGLALAGFIGQLLQTVIPKFQPDARAKVEEQAAKVTDAAGATALANGLMAVLQKVTGIADPIQATAAVTAGTPEAKALLAQAEQASLEYLDKLGPWVDKIAAAEQANWKANDDSADRAAARWAGVKDDIAQSLVSQANYLFIAALLAVAILVGVQLWRSDNGSIDSGTYALLSVLVYGIVRMADRPSAHRFGGAYDSAAVNTGSTVINQTIQERRKP
jgi:hypothetical protein